MSGSTRVIPDPATSLLFRVERADFWIVSDWAAAKHEGSYMQVQATGP